MTMLAAAVAALAVHASFDTRAPRFGAAIRSHVVVTIDRTRAREDTVRVVDDVAPLTALAAARTTRTTRGDTLVIAVDRSVACLDEACVSDRGVATLTLGRVLVTAVGNDGRTLRVSASRPELRVRGRVTTADLARARPPFRADTTPPAPSYRVAPSTLAALLDAAAAVLGLAAVAVVARAALARARRRRREAPVDELARALRLAREAEGRPVPDRRRALGLLARLLGRSPLGERTSGLAWSRPAPQPAEVAGLVDDVEREART
jgi:hypothetical protein